MAGPSRSAIRTSSAPTGTIQSQAFRDLNVWNLELAATASATNTAAIGAAASYTRSVATVRVGQASTAIKLRVNGALDLGMSRFEVEAGYLSHHLDNPLYKDFQGLVFKGQAIWYPTPLVTLTASAGRSLEPSGDPASGATIVTSWRLKADYELLRNLVLHGGIWPSRAALPRGRDVDPFAGRHGHW